jgi:DNA-binding NtrC family response regulator
MGSESELIWGRSAPVEELREELRGLARTGFRAVLVVGESGVGKELVAQTLHRTHRPCGPLETFNCPAVPADHLEAELFGTCRGAYPGAIDRPGAAERAKDGILFLDEVASMPETHQAKVLRLLESGEGRRLGATRSYRAGFGVVAATNEDIGGLVDRGSFRADLYYRLTQDGVLRVPPLREHPEDVPILVRRFLCELNDTAEPGAEAIVRLQRERWPGNVRQLRAAVRVASRLAAGAPLGVAHVERALLRLGTVGLGSVGAQRGFAVSGFHEATLELRRELLVEALSVAAGNQTLAGILLGLHRRRNEPDGPLDLRARKLAHRKFGYWWARAVARERSTPDTPDGGVAAPTGWRGSSAPRPGSRLP